MFLRNTWYVAGWASEVGDRLLGRRILNEPVLLYRLQSGEAVAIGDRCPHRFAPLHMGRQVGDAVQCGYHGLSFGPDGKCIFNPQSGGQVPPGAGVKRYALVERHGLLWIWMGDFAQADAQRIPDVGFIVTEGARSNDGYLHVRADYRLAVDNLMDLSHAAFLHEETLGRLTPSLSEGELTVSNVGSSIVAAITMRGVDIPVATGKVDQWLDMNWTAPGILVLEIGHVPVGETRTAHGRRAIHIVTPETDTTSHYFFRNAANPGNFPRDPFSQEDEPMLAACQEMMGGENFWSLKPVILRSDAGAVRVRRELDKLIRDEAAQIHQPA